MRKTWGEGRGGGRGGGGGRDNHSPFVHCRGQDPFQVSWCPGILTLARPACLLDRLCGWVGLCQSEMAWI